MFLQQQQQPWQDAGNWTGLKPPARWAPQEEIMKRYQRIKYSNNQRCATIKMTTHPKAKAKEITNVAKRSDPALRSEINRSSTVLRYITRLRVLHRTLLPLSLSCGIKMRFAWQVWSGLEWRRISHLPRPLVCNQMMLVKNGSILLQFHQLPCMVK